MSRIVIVGGGIAGVATAWFLARRGATDVVVLERERGLGWHATGQNAAILRTSTSDPLIEAMAREGAEFLRHPPPGFSPVPLYDPCGIVLASSRPSDAQKGWERRLDARGDAERLTPERLAELAPHFRAHAERAWFLRDEGRIDNAALLDGFERGARAAGIEIRTGAFVRELVLAGGRVCGVRLADGTIERADCTVVAAGAWALALGAAAGSRVRLRPTRRHLLVTAVDERVDPRWPVVWTDSDPFYARPESGGLMLCACDEVDVDPDELRPIAEVRELIARKTRRYLTGFDDAEVAKFWAGMRTLTADDRFVVGPDADAPGIFWVAGLAGHGMTCAASVGRLAADWIVDGDSEHPAREALDPSRFSERAPRAGHARHAEP